MPSLTPEGPSPGTAASVQRWDSAEAVQSTPVGGDQIRNGLAAAHLRGPRSIVHLLDHLLSPVIHVVADPIGHAVPRSSGPAGPPTAPMLRRYASCVSTT